MSTLEGRSGSALLVIDMQVGVLAGTFERDAVVARVASAVEKARRAEVPVVWVQQGGEQFSPGSEPWQLVPELKPEAGEPLIPKEYGDSFEETDLEGVLAAQGVGRLVIVGAQTDACIRATLHGALVRGYDALLVSDAHTTEDLTEWGAPPPGQVITHTNLYWSYHTAPGRTAGTVTTEELEFAS